MIGFVLINVLLNGSAIKVEVILYVQVCFNDFQELFTSSVRSARVLLFATILCVETRHLRISAAIRAVNFGGWMLLVVLNSIIRTLLYIGKELALMWNQCQAIWNTIINPFFSTVRARERNLSLAYMAYMFKKANNQLLPYIV